MAVVEWIFEKWIYVFHDRNYSTCQKPRGGRTNRGKMTGTCFPNGSKRIHESINTRYNTINRNAMNLHCVSKRKSGILRAIIESSFRYKRWNPIRLVYTVVIEFIVKFIIYRKMEIRIHNVVARWPFTLIFSISFFPNDSSMPR